MNATDIKHAQERQAHWTAMGKHWEEKGYPVRAQVCYECADRWADQLEELQYSVNLSIDKVGA